MLRSLFVLSLGLLCGLLACTQSAIGNRSFYSGFNAGFYSGLNAGRSVQVGVPIAYVGLSTERRPA